MKKKFYLCLGLFFAQQAYKVSGKSVGTLFPHAMFHAQLMLTRMIDMALVDGGWSAELESADARAVASRIAHEQQAASFICSAQ